MLGMVKPYVRQACAWAVHADFPCAMYKHRASRAGSPQILLMRMLLTVCMRLVTSLQLSHMLSCLTCAMLQADLCCCSHICMCIQKPSSTLPIGQAIEIVPLGGTCKCLEASACTSLHHMSFIHCILLHLFRRCKEPEVLKSSIGSTICAHAEAATAGNLLFEHLAKSTKQAIFESMTSIEVDAGTTIIQQGDPDAKTFYVLGLGCCEVLLQKPDWGDEPRSVLTYKSGRYACMQSRHNMIP